MWYLAVDLQIKNILLRAFETGITKEGGFLSVLICFYKTSRYKYLNEIKIILWVLRAENSLYDKFMLQIIFLKTKPLIILDTNHLINAKIVFFLHKNISKRRQNLFLLVSTSLTKKPPKWGHFHKLKLYYYLRMTILITYFNIFDIYFPSTWSLLIIYLSFKT